MDNSPRNTKHYNFDKNIYFLSKHYKTEAKYLVHSVI